MKQRPPSYTSADTLFLYSTRVRSNRILDPRRPFAFIGITIGEIELDNLCKLDLQFAKHRPSAPLLPRLLVKGKGRPLNSHRENIGGVEILVRRMLIIGTDQEIDRQIELGLIAQFLRELHVTVHIITVDRIDRTQCLLAMRAEEHKSELQSLLRISSAVFCLNKTN